MPVDLSILKDRTKQILRRLDHEMSLVRSAASLGMQIQPVKNLLYRQRNASGALSVGHLLSEFNDANIDPDEYEETCAFCGEFTVPDSNIVRDPSGAFCSNDCHDNSIGDFLLSAANVDIEDRPSFDGFVQLLVLTE